ncbi:beta-hexosaminidase subunit beta-like [Colias croceus]|uniref:beta-hexosaminidase subunit beta-like n=1 Tax=Colias crocea TaxID=72248 RepID=UPI001E280067|nr:beta-hexosaminidase subunit beta-like [Colias croceus]
MDISHKMIQTFLFFACLGIGAGMSVVNPGPKFPPTKGEVWPKPQEEAKEIKYYSFNPSHFSVKVVGHKCAILSNAIERYSFVVKHKIGSTRSRRERRKRRNGLSHDENYRGRLQELEVDLTAPCEEYPHVDMDESYNLNVSATAALRSPSIWGIIRGLETFSHLFYLSDDRNELRVNKTQIIDYPQYSHRGLLLDTSRHYISVANILKTLDAMAMNKMNVFHWHIVDDQSFPYQSERFPELSQQGAYDPSMVYTKDDIKIIVDYARDRAIRVIPEFDVPGHTRSWGNAYPSVLTECYRMDKVIGLGPMNPTKNITYKLLRDLFQEVQTWFPDKYFHIGGDEVELDCWRSNPELRDYMNKNNLTVPELHGIFMSNAIPLLANDSEVVVWQEVFDEHVPLSKKTLVQVWKGSWISEMVTVLTAGHRLIFSSTWYLDALGSGWTDYYWADPRQMVYDVTYNRTLLENIVGGEACMWGEMVDDRNVMSRVWPRASAVAERLWSANTIGRRSVFDTIPAEVYHRMEEHTCRMIRRGIDAQPPTGPGFCVA